MTGRNTSKDLHATKVGHMVKDVCGTAETWRELESLSGYKFVEAKRQSIIDELTVCRDYRDYLAEMVSRQDVKRTLMAISNMRGASIIDAYNNCDQTTDALIYKAAWVQFGVNVLTCDDLNLTCETIAKAALFALDSLPETKGGRPKKSHHERLARYCCKLWAECEKTHSAYVWENNASPMVQFASILFRLVDGVESDLFMIRDRLNSSR